MEYNFQAIPMIKNRPLGIVAHHSDWYVTFTLQQYVSGVETRATTIEDYNDCPSIIYMTSDNIYDLSGIQPPHHSSVIGVIECHHHENIPTTPNMIY